MARQHSKTLFELVKSLSKSEKRYITLSGQIHFKGKQNKHLLLFTLLQQQDELDFEYIKAQIYPEGTAKRSTFAELKNYLYNFILKSLITFDEVNSSSMKLKLGLLKLKVLFKRGLINACKEMLVSLNKLAKLTDDQLVLLELLNWERKIAHATFNVASLKSQKIENRVIVSKILKRLSTTLRLKEIFSDLFVLRLQFSNRIDGKARETLEDLIQQIPEEVYQTEVYEEKKLLLNIQNYYYLLKHNNEKCYYNIKELYQLIQSNKLDYKENPIQVVSIIDRLFYACIGLRRFEEGKSYLGEILKLTKSSVMGDLDKKRGVCSYYINSLVYQTNAGDFIKAQKTVDSFLKNYPESYYKTYIVNFNIFFLNIHFANGKYSEALDCISLITSEERQLRQDIKLFARCLEIIIHYELKNHLFIDTLVRSTKRYLKKDFNISHVETLLIKLIKKLINSGHSKSDQLDYFIQFKHLLDDKIGPQNLNGDMVIYAVDNWVQSKIKRKSISQIVKQKNQDFVSGD